MMKCVCGGVLLLLFSLPFSGARQAAPPKLGQRLWRAYQVAQADDEFLVWIYFSDKGRHLGDKYRAAWASLTPKSRQRRLTVRAPDQLIDWDDLPVEPAYVSEVRRRVRRVRHISKWLNAVSARATKRQIDQLRQFKWVKRIDLVARFTRPDPDTMDAPADDEGSSGEMVQVRADHAIDYGASLEQLEQINVPAVHDLGFTGEGVVIGVFDTGFNLQHRALESMRIVATHDFVNGDDDVSDGDDMGRGAHGTWVLSVIGGFAPGQLIGPAFGAEYILAKTENTESETPREEDNWIAALEWAEGLGVDVVSSSVGYLEFEPPFEGYTWRDMDGQTAAITRAAVMAVERGVVVVNAAGNSGHHPFHNTLMAPADGDGVITVGAVDDRGARARFSSVGPTIDGRIKPDVMARGVGVWVASANHPRAYRALSGTSFACPLVAGTAALLLSAHPEWSPWQVLDALHRTASQATRPDRLMGWGIVDALAAIGIEFGASWERASRLSHASLEARHFRAP